MVEEQKFLASTDARFADQVTPDLEIVVVTYGKWEVTRACLESIRSHRPRGLRTIVHVVDNDSPDRTPDAIATEFPEVSLHRQTRNLGFGAANNVVLRGLRAPYVLLLNPDTILEARVLEHLLARMAEEPDLGVLGCRLVTADGSFDHAAKRRIPTPVDALLYFLAPPRLRIRSRYLAPEVDEHGSGDVDAVNGALMLVRTSALRSSGVFDERYWMYGEDLDLCVRIADAGWRVHYDGRVTVTHLKSATSGRYRSPRLNWHFHRSMLIFYRDHVLGGHRGLGAVVVGGIVVAGVVRTVADASVRTVSRLVRLTRRAAPRSVEAARDSIGEAP